MSQILDLSMETLASLLDFLIQLYVVRVQNIVFVKTVYNIFER